MATQSSSSPTETCDVQAIHLDGVRRALAVLPAPDVAADLAALFGALGDPTRVRLLATLSNGPLCVCDLAATLGISQSAVSHQLRLLRTLHLVRARRDGKLVWYALDDDHIGDLLAIGFAHIGHQAPASQSEAV